MSEESFYPSFFKEVRKKEEFFKSNFSVKFIDANADNLKKFFFPLYQKEIMSRKDYTLDKEYIVSSLISKVESSDNYKLLLVYCEEELILVTLFSIKNGGLFICNRVFKKDFDKKLSHGATVNYWGEKIIFDYGKKMNVGFFSRGRDTHPFIGKTRIGLPLYKLKTGMKPMKSFKESDIIINEFTQEDIQKNNDIMLFFCKENEKGFYKDLHLYYPEKSISEDYLNEFDKVVKWSGLNFVRCEY